MSEERAVYLAAIPERDVLQTLTDAARTLGYLCYHTHRSDHSAAGFPDMVLVHPGHGRLVVIECKRERGRVSLAQAQWLGAFATVQSVTVGVVRPSDLDELVRWLGEV